MKLNQNVAKKSAKAGIIAALYVMLTTLLYPISYGGFQVRVAEALSILPLFYGEAVFGLTVGCLISNMIGTNGLLDVVFGTLATFIASNLTYLIGKKAKGTARFVLGGLPPVIVNAFVVPFTFLLTISNLEKLYFISCLQVFGGQALAVYLIGAPLYFSLIKRQK
ncbi:MAG: QueT transporter family protein [Clostridia bacterium]|nr:QueT transporter family protein [Clostridia bacterium]